MKAAAVDEAILRECSAPSHGPLASRGCRLGRTAGFGRCRLAAALEAEWEERRLFLWLPGRIGRHGRAALPLAPSVSRCVWLPARARPRGAAGAGLSAMRAPPGHRSDARRGFRCALVCRLSCRRAWRSRTQVDARVLERIRIVKLSGFVEEVDHRRPIGIPVRPAASRRGRRPRRRPSGRSRVRLTTRRERRDRGRARYVAVTARLLPPSRAALPGGYDFRPRRLFRRDRRCRLGPRAHSLPRRRPGPTGPCRTGPLPCLSTASATALAARVDARRSAAGMRAPSRPRWSPASATSSRTDGREHHPRGGDLPHHHHRRRPDDAGGRAAVRPDAARARAQPHPGVASSNQENGRRSWRSSAPSATTS